MGVSWLDQFHLSARRGRNRGVREGVREGERRVRGRGKGKGERKGGKEGEPIPFNGLTDTHKADMLLGTEVVT